MFGLVPFNFRGVSKRDDSLDNFFNDFFELDKNFFGETYSIKADIKDNGDKYILESEMPGIDKKDIGLNIKDDQLVLSYKTESNNETKNDNYIRRERKYGQFSRSFYIEDVNTEKIDAKYENGILKVTLPKLEEKQKKDIDIDIN